MSSIDLYLVLKKIPEVSDEEAKQAAEQTERLHRIETDIAELKVSIRITLALQLLILVILLVPLFQ